MEDLFICLWLVNFVNDHCVSEKNWGNYCHAHVICVALNEAFHAEHSRRLWCTCVCPYVETSAVN